MKPTFLLASCLLLAASFTPMASEAAVYERTAKNTITPIELDPGDALHFTLHNGETRELELVDSGADVLLTNVYPDAIKQERPDHGVMYQIWIDVEVDGQPVRLTRYLCSQFSYCEPYYFNGMRVWFEYNQDPKEFMTQGRGGYPEKRARIVVNDMTDRIAPDTFAPWYRRNERIEAREFANERIDARNNYKGDDMHMGGYFGATPHNGLDINMPKATQMMAPIDFDDHFITGNLNRWRGVRKWDNGSEWWLQSHHMFQMLVPEFTPLKQGTVYGEGAGYATGEVAHSHFAFRVMEEGERYTVDSWLIFWQTFRDRQDERGDIRAVMGPLSPAVAGETVSFRGDGSRSGSGNELLYSWSFGDGATSTEANPKHVYAKPGIYAVLLTIDDGDRLAQFIQNITVSGDAVTEPVATLIAPDEVEFLPWPSEATLVHAKDPGFMPYTLRFTATPSRPVPAAKQVKIVNAGGGELEKALLDLAYENSDNWCGVSLTGSGNSQVMDVVVAARGLAPGRYLTELQVELPNAVNGPQNIRVQLDVKADEPDSQRLVMLNSDPGFYATPWFWAPHSFWVNRDVEISVNAARWDRPMLPPALLAEDGKNRMGLSDRYLTNGHRTTAGQFFRFTPYLAAGEYRISTSEETPWDSTSEMNVRVRHAEGETMVRYKPGQDPVLGTFKFDEGRDGFVEFYAEDSMGQVTADALIFENVEYRPSKEEAEDAPMRVEEIDGLVAHWSFEDEGEDGQTAKDFAGGHDLKLHNMTGAAWTKGKVGKRALTLDGGDDYAVAGPLGLDPLQPRTIAGWIRLETVEQPAGAVIFGFDSGEDPAALRFSVPMFGDRLVADTGGLAWTVQGNRDTEWHHLAFSWDGDAHVAYLDGEAIIKVGNMYGKETKDLFRIGSDGPFFKGSIDDVRVYDRALTAEEIEAIYTSFQN